MASVEDFEAAVERVNGLSKTPNNDALLDLYGWYKQSTAGDVSTKRPGMLDIRGRAKWDAWKKRIGQSPDAARDGYIARARELGA